MTIFLQRRLASEFRKQGYEALFDFDFARRSDSVCEVGSGRNIQAAL
ncbi:MAG TPA: hypothetical protein VEW46_19120 [Pyrinomonadaceae bacterium]|nr:hypothetical protein [Pyrinomonadaceae bacterium]